jgi:hypothetical protein
MDINYILKFYKTIKNMWICDKTGERMQDLRGAYEEFCLPGFNAV